MGAGAGSAVGRDGSKRAPDGAKKKELVGSPEIPNTSQPHFPCPKGKVMKGLQSIQGRHLLGQLWLI